jgi:hypothetical protein
MVSREARIVRGRRLDGFPRTGDVRSIAADGSGGPPTGASRERRVRSQRAMVGRLERSRPSSIRYRYHHAGGIWLWLAGGRPEVDGYERPGVRR